MASETRSRSATRASGGREVICRLRRGYHSHLPWCGRRRDDGGDLRRGIGSQQLQLLAGWEEYRENHPEGYRYSRFCDLYKGWLRRQEVVLRHEHRAGEKLFVDYAGDTIPIYPGAGMVS